MKKALALITALLLLCPLWWCRRNDPPPAPAVESEPLSYAYTLCVTINPQLTLFMDAGDRVAGVTVGTVTTAAETKASASETEGTPGTTTTKKPAPTTAATTKKPLTAADLNGSFAYQVVKENAESGEKTGYRYAVTFDIQNSTFRYSIDFGSPIERFIEWGMYKTEEEALADKNVVWNRIDGRYYGVQAGDSFVGGIGKLTPDSVAVTDDSGKALGTLAFAFDAEKGTLTCKNSTIEELEELTGLVLTREK